MKNPKVKISIIVCTYNNERILLKSLNSLLNQTYDSQSFEIIIVDNDSEDNTKQLCDKLISESPKNSISYFFEKQKGLSHARNRGINESIGETLAFIDDDAIAESDWLSNIAGNFTNYSFHALGGKVLPLYESPKPSWLDAEIERLLTVLDLGEKMIPFDHPRIGPCGTNMAYRKTVFDTIGYFDPQLGRKGANLISAEETDILVRMTNNNMDFIYCPDCVVHHPVPKDRLTRSFLRKRYYYQGLSVACVSLKYNSLRNIFINDIKHLFSKRKHYNIELSKSDNKLGKLIFHYELKLILAYAYLMGLFLNYRSFSNKRSNRRSRKR